MMDESLRYCINCKKNRYCKKSLGAIGGMGAALIVLGVFWFLIFSILVGLGIIVVGVVCIFAKNGPYKCPVCKSDMLDTPRDEDKVE